MISVTIPGPKAAIASHLPVLISHPMIVNQIPKIVIIEARIME